MNELKPITNLTEWREFKSTLKFSTVDCFICRDRLYYGNRCQIKKSKAPRFQCQCGIGMILDDKCSLCKVPVIYETKYISGIMLRCTCGHTALVEMAKLEELTSA